MIKIRKSTAHLLFGAFYFSSMVFAADPPKKTGPDVWWEAEKTRNEVRALRKNDPREKNDVAMRNCRPSSFDG
jgi:hypothetical protein